MCWGAGESGQLGDGATNGSNSPVEVLGTTAIQVSNGESHSCALLENGKIMC